MYTIKRAAELTGVSVATLRAWERRYGIGTPSRTDSGYRLYDEQAIADINAMQHLINQGFAARQAAEAVLSQRGQVRTKFVKTEAELDEELSSLRERVLDGARRMDEVTLTHALDDMFAKASFEHVVDNWLTPVMFDIGEEWVGGRFQIAAEHLVSNAVMRRLGIAFESAPLPPRGPMVLVGLSANSYHEIGSLAFATAARRIGLGALYLGANVPKEAWISAVAAHSASAVVLSVVLPEDVNEAQQLTDALLMEQPQLLVAVGGRLNSEVTGPVLHLEEGVGASAASLARRLLG